MDYKVTQRSNDYLLPISLIRYQVNLFDEQEDEFLYHLYDVAVSSAEAFMNRILNKGTVMVQTEKLLNKLPLGEGEAVSKVTYKNDSEERVELDSSLYEFNEITNSIEIKREVANKLKSEKANSYQITFTTGWDETTLPPVITQGLLVLIASLYENREDAIVGSGITSTPSSNTHKYLLSKYKIHRMG